MKIYGATVLGVLLVSSLIAFLLSSRLRAVIEMPISHLVRATTSVSETNDYGIRAQKLSGDELGVLVDRFNEMLGGIQSRDNDLRTALREREEALRDAEKARERFRFMAESMPQKIFTATPSGDVDYYNRQWMEFTGLPFERIKDWGWTQFIHPDDLEENVRTLAAIDRDRRAIPFSTSLSPRRWRVPLAPEPGTRHAGRRGEDFDVDRHRIPTSTSRRRKRRNCAGPMKTSSSSPIPPATIFRNRSGTLRCTAKLWRSAITACWTRKGSSSLGS